MIFSFQNIILLSWPIFFNLMMKRQISNISISKGEGVVLSRGQREQCHHLLMHGLNSSNFVPVLPG